MTQTRRTQVAQSECEGKRKDWGVAREGSGGGGVATEKMLEGCPCLETMPAMDLFLVIT